MVMNRQEKQVIKGQLLEMLKQEKAFWSYEQESVTLENMGDDLLIANVMRHLDLPEIKQLFSIFSFTKIKRAWLDLLVPEGEYLYTLNKFFAWYYFKISNPSRYLKAMETRRLNKLFS